MLPLILVDLAAQVEECTCFGRYPTLTTAAPIREWMEQAAVFAEPASCRILLPQDGEVHLSLDELFQLDPVTQ